MMLRDLLFRLRALVRRHRVEEELDEELRFHLERQAEVYVRSGQSPDRARARARLALGGLDQVKEQCRESRGVSVVETTLHDLRYTWRTLRRSPWFATVAILTLALGIAANVAMFSVMNGILLRPLPYEDPDRIVRLWESNPAKGYERFDVLPGSFLDWRERSRAFEALALFHDRQLLLTDGDAPERVPVTVVSPSLFQILGARPMLGRGFLPEEGRAPDELERVEIVLSHRLWQHRFGGDPDIVGKQLRADIVTFTIVGVMPPGFELSKGSAAWLEVVAAVFDGRGDRWQRGAIGKLRPGISIDQARAELRTIARQAEIDHPQTNAGWSVVIEPLTEVMVGDVRWALVALYGAVACLLLIACANVASALLARANGRLNEMAVRVALGATGRRLMRLALTEGAVLAVVAGGLGLLLAHLLLVGLLSWAPADLPRVDEIAIDGRAVAFALGLSVLTALVVGLAPWIGFGRTSIEAALRGGRTVSTTRGRARAGAALVAAEIALTLVLLASAGLLIRSFLFLRTLDLGVDPAGVWTTELSMPMGEFSPGGELRVGERPDWEGLGERYASLVDEVRNVPGIESAATVSPPPLAPDTPDFFQHGRELDRDTHAERWPVLLHKVTPEYFRVLRLPVVRGRAFTERDRASRGLFPDVDKRPPGVAVVNEAMARRFWPGRDPLGQDIVLVGESIVTYRTIVGVVGDVRPSLADVDPAPALYVSRAESRPDFKVTLLARTSRDRSSTWSRLRSSGAGLTMGETLRRQLRASAPAMSVGDLQPLDALFAESLAEQRFTMVLVSAFGALAILLAAVGLYGVVAFIVSQRTRELGVRVALGARRRDILALVLSQAARPVLLGLVAGALGAAAVGRLVAALVVGVGSFDPVVLGAVALVILLVAGLAVLAPARAAAAVDPVLVLRQE